nr:O-antigen ligase family protein [Flavobacteriales bacterium]
EVRRAATEREHDAKAQTSSEVRWLTWDSAWRLFKERPLSGTGTGDIKDELVRDYIAHDFTTAAEHRLNAHDQFLQTAACLGIPGAMLILAMVVVPLLARGRRDALTTLFLLICAVNWVVESMLEVQAGAVFFAYFASVVLWSGPMDRSSPPPTRPMVNA